MKEKRIIGVLMLVAIFLFTSAALATEPQPAGGGAPGEGGGKDLTEIGKPLNNPVSSIWNITTQSNMLDRARGQNHPALRAPGPQAGPGGGQGSLVPAGRLGSRGGKDMRTWPVHPVSYEINTWVVRCCSEKIKGNA